MVENNYEDGASVSSLAWSFISPIETLKYQYGSIWALGTYNKMSKTGAIGYNPTFFLPWRFGKSMSDTTASLKDKAFGLLGGHAQFTPESSIAKIFAQSGLNSSQLNANTSRMQKGLVTFMHRNKWKSFTENELYNRVNTIVRGGITSMEGAAGAQKTATVASDIASISSKLTKTASRYMGVMRAGRLLFTGMIGVQIGSALAGLTSFAFKGSMAATELVQSKIEGMRNLEFGGLSGGYMASAAVTERQRAMQELQRTPINASHFMGNEASIYSGMI